MKTKAKLTLAISVMSAAVLAAGVTSTFAWFTTNSRATANFANLNVNAPSTIKISGYQVTYDGTKNDATKVSVAAMTQTAANVVTGSTAALGAVSTPNGKDFYAPTSLLSDDSEEKLTFAAWKDVTSAQNKYKSFVKYNLKVDVEKQDTPKQINVSLKEDTPLGTHVTDWYRVSIYEVADNAALNVTTDIDAKTNGYSAFFAHSEASDDAYIKAAGEDGANGVNGADRKVIAPNVSKQITGFQASTNATVTREFVVAVWLEGEAAARQNDASGESVNVGLIFEFAA